MTDEQFAWWLVGLVDGEGHFGVTKASHRVNPFYRCVFRVAMVESDRPLLEMAQGHTGWGKLYSYAPRSNARQPVAIWTVSTKAVGDVADFFSRHRLQSKKAAEFDIWAPAARAQARRSHGRRDPHIAAALESAYEELRALNRGGRHVLVD